MNVRSEAWAVWEEGRESFKQDSEDKYLLEKRALLQRLCSAGKGAMQAVKKLEKRCTTSKPAAHATVSLGLKQHHEDLTHHIFISEEVTEALDKLYIQYYRSNGASKVQRLACCFGMMGVNGGDARVHFERYLGDVKKQLVELSSTPQVKLLVEIGDLQALGLKEAASKLNPLFWPLQGRVCLPLPTPSMLEDLQACLDVHEQLITEVLSCFFLKQL